MTVEELAYHVAIATSPQDLLEPFMNQAIRSVKNAEDLYSWYRMERDVAIGIQQARRDGVLLDWCYYLCARIYLERTSAPGNVNWVDFLLTRKTLSRLARGGGRLHQG
jgi:hypothetical protein